MNPEVSSYPDPTKKMGPEPSSYPDESSGMIFLSLSDHDEPEKIGADYSSAS